MRKMITLICPLICLDFVSISPKPFSVTFIKVSINKKAQIFFGSVDFILLGSFTWDFIILDQIKYDSYYMNDPILGSFHVWGCINDALLIWSINLQSVDFSMFLWFFSAIVFATTKKTQQKIARVINYHSSLTKIPVLYFNRVKIAFFWTT